METLEQFKARLETMDDQALFQQMGEDITRLLAATGGGIKKVEELSKKIKDHHRRMAQVLELEGRE